MVRISDPVHQTHLNLREFADMAAWLSVLADTAQKLEDLLVDVPPEERQRLLDLPSAVEVRGKWIDVDYDVETVAENEPAVAVARLRLPEKLAKSLVDEEMPVLDRPLRFIVTRGPRGTVRASSLSELQALLDRPWSPDEMVEDRRRKRDTRPPRREENRKPFARGRRGDRKRRRR